MSDWNFIMSPVRIATVALVGALVVSGCSREEAKPEQAPVEPVKTNNLSEARRQSMLDPVYNAQLKERLNGRREQQMAIAKIERELAAARAAKKPDEALVARLETDLKAAQKSFSDYEKASRAIVTRQIQKDLQVGTNFQQKGN